MGKFLIINFESETYAILMDNVYHIFSYDQMIKVGDQKIKFDLKLIQGIIKYGKEEFFITDVRKQNTASNDNKILILNLPYHDEIHYEKKMLHFHIGLVFDNVKDIIISDKIKDKFIMHGKNIYPLYFPSDYLDNAQIVKMKYEHNKYLDWLKSIEKKNLSHYENIALQNKIVDIWKDKHR